MVDEVRRRLSNLVKAIEKKTLLVGIPGGQEQPATSKGTPPPLHVIGYIMEHGDEERGIPPRPFLKPGVEGVKDEIVAQMAKGAQRAMASGLEQLDTRFLSEMDNGMRAAGLIAQAAVKQKMRDGPFTPLAPATIAARARRRDKGTGKLVNSVSTRNARKFRKLQAEGVPTEVLNDAGLAKPLIDTGALLQAVQFAIKG